MTAIWLAVLLAITPPISPDPILTPGDVMTTSTKAICTPGYATKARDVSTAKKLSVYEAYGLMVSGRWRLFDGVRIWQSDFEVDHLISLQLGGSNELINLWPQSYLTPTFNATSKDALENRLHWLVCHGQLALTDAQQMIREDWIGTYRMYFMEGK